MTAGRELEPHLFVILGGSGDLARRKLFPAIFRLLLESDSKKMVQVLGVGTRDLGDDGLREMIGEALVEAGFGRKEATRWCDSCVHYQANDGSREANADFAARVEKIERERSLPGNRIFYLALPPHVFEEKIEMIGEAGLASSQGWVRLVVEKPFGSDLASARALNRLIHRYFDESQVYRIDHYLGKETVQNLSVFRFANSIFESLWNRERIGSVHVTVAESLGLEGRVKYYEEAGAFRDMIQNHLTQLLTLLAMEPPASFKADAIRNEKVKVLNSISSIEPEEVVLGQYTAGESDGVKVPGYLEEEGVAPGSRTPTFVSLKVEVNNWRWQGVPFFLRTGKRLPRRVTRICISFRHPPVFMFESLGAFDVNPNRLLITLQPDEGFHLQFDVKEPGEPFRLKTEELHFHYKEVFGPLPDAYHTLIYDIIEGDQTLFVRSDEVEASWNLYDPIIGQDLNINPYPAGSWGPPESDKLLAAEGTAWLDDYEPE